MSIKVVKVAAWTARYHPEIRYMGRSTAGWLESEFHNPFHIGKDGTRAQVLLKFIQYWYAPEQAGLRARALRLIRDTDILGCWCHPLPCHCEIIAGYLAWKRAEETLLWL